MRIPCLLHEDGMIGREKMVSLWLHLEFGCTDFMAFGMCGKITTNACCIAS